MSQCLVHVVAGGKTAGKIGKPASLQLPLARVPAGLLEGHPDGLVYPGARLKPGIDPLQISFPVTNLAKRIPAGGIYAAVQHQCKPIQDSIVANRLIQRTLTWQVPNLQVDHDVNGLKPPPRRNKLSCEVLRSPLCCELLSHGVGLLLVEEPFLAS